MNSKARIQIHIRILLVIIVALMLMLVFILLSVRIIVLVLVLTFEALQMLVLMLVLAFAIAFAILSVFKGYLHGSIPADIVISNSLSISSSNLQYQPCYATFVVVQLGPMQWGGLRLRSPSPGSTSRVNTISNSNKWRQVASMKLLTPLCSLLLPLQCLPLVWFFSPRVIVMSNMVSSSDWLSSPAPLLLAPAGARFILRPFLHVSLHFYASLSRAPLLGSFCCSLCGDDSKLTGHYVQSSG